MATESLETNKHARRDAMQSGRKTYVSPAACKFCETSLRYTCNSLCVECDRIKTAARKADPEKAAADRARNAARVARYRERLNRKGANLEIMENKESDDFADILG